MVIYIYSTAFFPQIISEIDQDSLFGKHNINRGFIINLNYQIMELQSLILRIWWAKGERTLRWKNNRRACRWRRRRWGQSEHRRGWRVLELSWKALFSSSRRSLALQSSLISSLSLSFASPFFNYLDLIHPLILIELMPQYITYIQTNKQTNKKYERERERIRRKNNMYIYSSCSYYIYIQRN